MKSSPPLLVVVVWSCLFTTIWAYQVPHSAVSSSSAAAAARCDRRQVFSFLAGAGFATAFALQSPDTAWAQVDACPPKSQNCIRTTWTPPAGTSPSKAFASIKSVIESYPQQGQANVDLGGWKIVEDDGKSTLRAEFTSGIGTFAKFFNGGKPFVDDLRVQVDGDGAVQIRSNSRVGESDLGVNQKRLVYLADAIAKQGWTIPKVKY